MKTALITGASGGIGLELARIHAAKGDNLVLVARSLDKLQQLKHELEQQHGIKVHTIGKDLATPTAAQEVYDETTQQNITIDYLINNAGVGDYGLFIDSNWEKQSQMISLNIHALTQLTYLYLPGMVARRYGRVMNMASLAAFIPGPTMAVYFATKAYVLHFSEAIGNELAGTGVTVTALCPGATESGFQDAADMHSSQMIKGKKLPTSKSVAIYGYKAMMKGKPVAIHGIKNYLMANSIRLPPRSWVVKISRALTE